MKRRCFPVRADHKLLTPDTHSQSGVQLSPVTQVNLQQSAHLNDLYSSERDVGTATQRQEASPGRRLRFEDETEMDAESRYQERQRRQVGPHRTGLVISKPHLNLYIDKGRAAGPQVDNHCHICGTGARDRSNISQHPPASANRGQSMYRTHLNWGTEPIRETYIGSVTQVESRVGWAMCPSNMHVRRRTNLRKDDQMKYITDLPINPYATDQLNTSRCPSYSLPPMTSSITSLSVRLNGTKEGQNVNHQEQGRPGAAQFQCVSELTDSNPCVDLQRRSSTFSYLPAQVEPMMMSQLSLDSPANNQIPSTSRSSSDGQVKQPIRAELHPLPEQDCSKNKSCHLHLCQLFSNVRLTRAESGSLDRLTLNPSPPANRKTSSLLKKSPSAQSLSVGLPFSTLKKSSSVQFFGAERKKKDRSADYRPGSNRFLPQTLSIKHVGHPGSSYSVGRLLQICSDETFVLELSRPARGTFGFIISRGKGHSDTGVYVEDILDLSTEKLYSGLLSIGDKILEVNEEKVSGLNLDKVTLLLTQNPSVTLRVLRHQRTPP